MYKGTLKDGDLDKFTPAELEQMKLDIEARKKKMLALYTVENKINI